MRTQLSKLLYNDPDIVGPQTGGYLEDPQNLRRTMEAATVYSIEDTDVD